MNKTSAPKEKSSTLVPVLACVLNQLCLSNDKHAFSPKESTSKFHAMRIPYITLKEYLDRIAKYSGCSSESLVLALVYIDRIIQGSQSFIVNSYSIHRLLITSVMLAAKFFDDQYYNNAYYAKVGGVSYSEMNALEVEFLFMLNFDLFVTTETYKQYYEELWSHANSSHASICGCNKAKVPLLCLPRFDEIRQTPKQTIFDLTNDDQTDFDPVDESNSFTSQSNSETTQIPLAQMPISKQISIPKVSSSSNTLSISPSFKTDFITRPTESQNQSYFDIPMYPMDTDVSFTTGYSNLPRNLIEDQKDHIMVDIRPNENSHQIFKKQEEQKDGFAWQNHHQVPPGFSYGNFSSFSHETKEKTVYDIPAQAYKNSIPIQNVQTWNHYQALSPRSQGIAAQLSKQQTLQNKRQNSKGDMNFWQVLPVY